MDVRNKNMGAREVPFLFLALLKSSTITCSWAYTDFFVVWPNSSFYSPKGCKSKLLQNRDFFSLTVPKGWAKSHPHGEKAHAVSGCEAKLNHGTPLTLSSSQPAVQREVLRIMRSEKTRMINSYMVLLIAKNLHWLFCLGMNPRKERSKIQLPIWMSVPELVVEKAAKELLLELLCGPDPFCPSNFSTCSANWKSLGRFPAVHHQLGIWSV